MSTTLDPVILYRPCNHPDDDLREMRAASEAFPFVQLRGLVPDNSLVVGRYSVLPHYRELEADLALTGSRLINTYAQHRWIAEFEWYSALRELTPQSWPREDFPHSDHPGPFVVKGSTNSFKWQWDRRMYAPDRKAAITLAIEVEELLPGQRAIIREYVPLRVLEQSVVGPPFTNEWRCFFLRGYLIAAGYYWSCVDPETKTRAFFAPEAMQVAQQAAAIAAEHCTFFVVDVAETVDGRWIVVELNDGQCAGLSEIEPQTLYDGLRAVLVS